MNTSRRSNIHQVFEAHVARSPGAVAVIAGDRQLTYEQLNEEANRLAHHLIALGVGPDHLVGVLMERSLEMIISIVGILKAGGAYFPLDPDYPARRLAFMTEDAGLGVILTMPQVVERAPAGVPHVIPIDFEQRLDTDQPRDNPSPSAHPSNLAYVNYTSGSTGEPKGVEVPHRAVVRLVVGANYFHVNDSDVFLHLSAFSFDATTFEIWGPLLNGARCVIMPPGIPTIEDLKSVIREQRVTILWLTASLFNAIIDEEPDTLLGIEQLLIGGEALSVEHVRRAYNTLPSIQIINGYGPTEGTTFTCCYAIPREIPAGTTSIPLGRAINGTEVFVLDDNQRPVAAGVPGELFIGGDGLARGYLNRPELTRERFVPHPFSDSPGARLYRTGDRVCALSDGTLDFLGRVDDQVKLHGFRIEPGEIEAVLKTHDAIRDAIVLPITGQSGDMKLVACLVAVDGTRPTSGALRDFLAEQIPAYMVPSSFVHLDKFPLTPVGKTDREALRGLVPGRSRTPLASARPRNATEEKLAGIWSEILGSEEIGIYEDFFEWGGDSLLATRVVSRIRSALGPDLAIRSIFENPTIAQLARIIEETPVKGASKEPPIVAVPRDRELPQSFSQQRLWFLDQLHPGSPVYNEPLCVRLTGPLNTTSLDYALNGIIARHEALRANFTSIDGRPVQTIQDKITVAVALDDLVEIAEADRSRELELQLAAEARRPFDLASGPLLRARLFRLSANDHVFLITMHHIVCDAWSLGILFEELSHLYSAHQTGRSGTLPVLPLQSVDFAVWQRQQFEQQELDVHLDYWRQKLAGAPASLELPADHPRAPELLLDGETRSIELSEELLRDLSSLSRKHGVSLFMTLLSAFQVILHRYTAQDDLVIGCPTAGRTRREIEPLIGFFVNTLPIRSHLAEDPTFLALLDRTRETTLTAHAHQDLPLEVLVESMQPKRGLDVTPLFQVAFVLQDAFEAHLELPGVAVRSLSVDCAAAKFDLTMVVEKRGEGLKVSMEYRTGLFERNRIDVMLEHFCELVQRIRREPGQRISQLSGGIEPLPSRVASEGEFSARPLSGAVFAHNDVERALTRIWSELLKCEVQRDDDFFDLGGHSLLAIRLFARIERELGLELPVSLLFENPTIAGLSAIVQNRAGTLGGSSIVTIRRGGNGTPVYLLPSLGGELFVSQGLTNLPSDHSIHGFHFSGPQIERCELNSIEVIAEAFVKDLLRFQPSGFCCLIGYSFGGALAFEMARQLNAAGREVEPLVLLDAGVRGENATKAGLAIEVARFLRNLPLWTWDILFKSSPREIVAYMGRKARALGRRPMNGDRETARDIFNLSDVPESHIQRMDSNLSALRRYRGRAYHGRITLFRGRARPLLQSHEYDLGWGQLTDGGVDVRVMPCSHDDIMEETFIRQIARQIAQLLRKSEPQGASK